MVAAVPTSPNRKLSSLGRAHQNPGRPPLLPSEADNGVVGPRRQKSREVTSRYLSSTSSSSTTTTTTTSTASSNSSSSRRCPSPLPSRTVPMTPMSAPSAAIKRSQSVERRRRETPRPNTPGSAGEMSAAAKLLVTSKRSLSVSFQGPSCSVPINKPSPVTNNLRGARKGTPERRKPTPVRDQTENSGPIDQHRWPGRSREVNCLTRSLDYTSDKKKLGGSVNVVRALQQSMINESSKASFTARLEVQPSNAELDKAVQLVGDANSAFGSGATSDPVASDTESVSSGSTGGVQECGSFVQGRGGQRGIVVPARFWQETTNRLRRLPEPGSPVSKNNGLKAVGPSKLNAMKKSYLGSPISSPQGVSSSKGLSSPLRGAARPASPSKPVTSSASSPSRGMLSPSRVRNGAATMLNNNLGSTPSILSFAAADVRKVGENRIADAHILRVLYNQYFQWRLINARADAAMLVQKVTAEESLYNAWVTILKLGHSVKSKRMELQLLRQNLKLYSILKGQMLHLDDWDLIYEDQSSSLLGAIEALEASTLRLPVVGCARADIQSAKDAICSAVDVMQAMASSICTLLTKVAALRELVTKLPLKWLFLNSLWRACASGEAIPKYTMKLVDQVNLQVSELANVAAKERALLDQCNDLLSTLTTLQVKDCSLRTHIIQLRRA